MVLQKCFIKARARPSLSYLCLMQTPPGLVPLQAALYSERKPLVSKSRGSWGKESLGPEAGIQVGQRLGGGGPASQNSLPWILDLITCSENRRGYSTPPHLYTCIFAHVLLIVFPKNYGRETQVLLSEIDWNGHCRNIEGETKSNFHLSFSS